MQLYPICFYLKQKEKNKVTTVRGEEKTIAK